MRAVVWVQRGYPRDGRGGRERGVDGERRTERVVELRREDLVTVHVRGELGAARAARASSLVGVDGDALHPVN